MSFLSAFRKIAMRATNVLDFGLFGFSSSLADSILQGVINNTRLEYNKDVEKTRKAYLAEIGKIKDAVIKKRQHSDGFLYSLYV